MSPLLQHGDLLAFEGQTPFQGIVQELPTLLKCVGSPQGHQPPLALVPPDSTSPQLLPGVWGRVTSWAVPRWG